MESWPTSMSLRPNVFTDHCAVVADSLNAMKMSSLANGLEATVFRRDKGKPLELQSYISKRIAEISTIIKDLKEKGVLPSS